MQKWNETLWLFTPDEFEQLPNGTALICINGTVAVKGTDSIDMDTRFFHIAYGITDPLNHPESELFTKFKLCK